MTKKEVMEFMKKIKGNYQEFSIEDYVVKTWYEALSKFDTEDVYKKLNKHLIGEMQSRPPRLTYIVKGLKTPEQKAKANNIAIRCTYCNELLSLDETQDHLDRHSSIEYILKNEHYLNKEYNVEKMLDADKEKFDKFYDKFLADLYCKIPDGEEKLRLEKIIFYGRY